MDYLPLFVALKDRPCLVVGGGAVAARKARALLRAGARVTILAPHFCDEVRALSVAGQAVLLQERYRRHRLQPFFFVVAATNDEDTNRRVSADAHAALRLCNVVDDRERSTAIVPAIVDRSPVQVAVSTGGRSPVLARRIKAAIERLLPANLGSFAQRLDALRPRVAKAIPEPIKRRRFWERLIDSPTSQTLADEKIEDVLKDELQSSRSPGIAYLIGAGPGDADLLTVKAQRLLGDADVVLYDRLVSQEILDRARRDALFIDVGKSPGGKKVAQEATNALLIRYVRLGKRVARLKGGDPFIFGRGGEELTALRREGLNVEVVPGITAALGCAAATGVPLTHRGVAQTVTLATAHRAEGQPGLDWDALCSGSDTLVFYMGVASLSTIRRELLRRLSPQTPAIIVESATTPHERVRRTSLLDLELAAENPRLRPPALLIVGATAGLTDTQAAAA